MVSTTPPYPGPSELRIEGVEQFALEPGQPLVEQVGPGVILLGALLGVVVLLDVEPHSDDQPEVVQGAEPARGLLLRELDRQLALQRLERGTGLPGLALAQAGLGVAAEVG